MLNNLKIGVRLIAGFAIVLILLVVVSVLSVTRLADLNTEVNDLVTDKYPKTIDAIDIVRAMNGVAQINRNLLLITDPAETQKQMARMTEQRKIISDNIASLEKTITSDEGKKLLAKMIETRGAYVSTLEKYTGTGAATAAAAVSNAAATVTEIEANISVVVAARAKYGADMATFSSAAAALGTEAVNAAAQYSAVMDTDYAVETTNMLRNQILQQAGSAMLAQANQVPNGVLALLR